MSHSLKIVVGIDEVGRGPLAGPVTVCVVACSQGIYTKLKRNKNLPPLGKDSKKLSPNERQKYAELLKTLMSRTVLDTFSYKIINISNKIIDAKGISFAIKFAISSGIKKLKLSPKTTHIFLDGGLKAPKEFQNQKTIIKGDEKEKIIAWASILAKVSRDYLMIKLSKKYSKYDWKNNKGYGTKKHIENVKKFGISLLHRKTFCKKVIGVRNFDY